MTTTPTSGAADLRATFSEMLVDLPNTEPYTLFQAGFDAALAAGQATVAQAVVPAGWKLALPGGKHTDEWESARVGDYNRGWNDYRKAAVSALSKITSEDRVRDGWAKASQWLRNNYQDHPNIASLCDAMLVAANTLTPVIECTCKAEDMPFGGCCKAPQPIPSPAPAQPVQDGERAYPPLPAPSGHIEYPSRPYESAWVSSQDAYSEEQMRAFADATYALRASHGQAPATQQAGEMEVFGLQWPGEDCINLSTVFDTEAEALEYICGTPGVRLVRFSSKAPTAQVADSVLEDAALWHWLAEYLVGTRTDLDDEIVASETVNDLRKLVKAAIKQGANHD